MEKTPRFKIGEEVVLDLDKDNTKATVISYCVRDKYWTYRFRYLLAYDVKIHKLFGSKVVKVEEWHMELDINKLITK